MRQKDIPPLISLEHGGLVRGVGFEPTNPFGTGS